MTKNEFLEKLRAALGNDLSGSIIQENVNYYNGYITDEVSRGRSETEVIVELGDPWVIAQTIIDTEQAKSGVGTQEEYVYEDPGEKYQKKGSESSGHVYTVGFNSRWKRLLLILGIIGVIVLIIGVIGGIISLLAPILIPLIVVMTVIRIFGKKK